jgi:hypothetical protein
MTPTTFFRGALAAVFAFAGCVATAATPSAGLAGGAMINGVPQAGAVAEARADQGPAAAASYLVATPISYSFSGAATGTVGDFTFTGAAIVVDAVGDAAAVSNSGGDLYCNVLASVTVTIQGVGSMTVTDPLAIFDTHSIQAIGLQRGCNTLDWIGMYGAPFATYDLTTAYGPAAGGSQYVQGTLNTTAGVLSITTSNITTFVAGGGAALPAPAASLTPASLAYGTRTIGTTSGAQTVTLANGGTGSLAIRSIDIAGDYAFASACPATLAPGASCTIDVTFSPLVAGSRPGSLSVSHNAAGSPSTVALDGTGVAAPAPAAEPSTRVLDFGVQPVGTDSAAQSVIVTNSGNATLTFDAVTVAGDFFRTPPPAPAPAECAIALAPGASCQIAVAFHPTALNLRQGTLSIATNATTLAVALMGTGLTLEAPQLSMPASIAFPPQALGTRSAGIPLGIRNTSPHVATLIELTAAGDFAISGACTTIAPGESCSLLVFFQPTATGAREGAITVRTMRDLAPYAVTLSGAGEENRLPALQLSATSLGFGNALVGMPITRDLTLRNVGNGPLVVTRILSTGDFFTDGACVGTVAVGGACNLRITFLASTAGGRAGVVQILSNDPNSPHVVSLGGTGCFVPTPSRVRFGVLLCGS